MTTGLTRYNPDEAYAYVQEIAKAACVDVARQLDSCNHGTLEGEALRAMVASIVRHAAGRALEAASVGALVEAGR